MANSNTPKNLKDCVSNDSLSQENTLTLESSLNVDKCNADTNGSLQPSDLKHPESLLTFKKSVNISEGADSVVSSETEGPDTHSVISSSGETGGPDSEDNLRYPLITSCEMLFILNSNQGAEF